MNACEQLELEEELTPNSSATLITGDTNVETGDNNGGPDLREALRTLRRLDERAAILELLADQAMRLFCAKPSDAGDREPEYMIERRDGSTSAANPDIVLDLSIEIRRMAVIARDHATALLRAGVDISGLPNVQALLAGEEDVVADEEGEPTAVAAVQRSSRPRRE